MRPAAKSLSRKNLAMFPGELRWLRQQRIFLLMEADPDASELKETDNAQDHHQPRADFHRGVSRNACPCPGRLRA
jgi:hypothetical protein